MFLLDVQKKMLLFDVVGEVSYDCIVTKTFSNVSNLCCTLFITVVQTCLLI